MELKSKKALSLAEKALAEREKALAEREKELAEREKALEKGAEKKKSYHNLLYQAFKEIALNIDKGAIKELADFIAQKKSPGDKWNYIAFFHKALNFFSINEFELLKALAGKEKSAGIAFKQLKNIFPDKCDSEDISSESR